jgi:hypothetical protein
MYFHNEDTSYLSFDYDSYTEDFGTKQIQTLRESFARRMNCKLLKQRKKHPEGIFETQFIDEKGKIFCIITVEQMNCMCWFKDTKDAWNEYDFFFKCLTKDVSRYNSQRMKETTQ